MMINVKRIIQVFLNGRVSNEGTCGQSAGERKRLVLKMGFVYNLIKDPQLLRLVCGNPIRREK